MKNPSKISLTIASLFSFAAIVCLFYLTKQHWDLKLGISAGQSICNLSQSLNCDAVSASKYASFLGAPIALWGAISFLVYLVVLGCSILFQSENLLRHQFYLACIFLLASFVMASISFAFMSTYCLFCIASYICSILVFFAAKNMVADQKVSLAQDIRALFTTQKSLLLIYLAIPIASYALQDASRGEDLKKLAEIKQAAIQDWSRAPQNTFEGEPSVKMGARDEEAKVVLVEFADFLCPHCQLASPTLKAFVAAHKDVQLRFYNFPLSGDCNEAVSHVQPLRCHLAKLVQCAEEEKQQGAETLSMLFESHGNLSTIESTEAVAQKIKISKEDLKECVEKEETTEKIRAQAKAGEKVGIKGTPSIFINGKFVRYRPSLPVLQAVYEEAVKTPVNAQ